MATNFKCILLLTKNFRSYTRFEIVCYLFLPLLLLHLVWIRNGHNQENMGRCMTQRNGTQGDIVNLNYLYNSMESIAHRGPEKIILAYTENGNNESQLKSTLKRILKLRKVISVDSEDKLERKLINGNYLCGVVWKNILGTEHITIRFPSVIRTIPTNLWNTDQFEAESNVEKPVYLEEGFSQFMYALLHALNNNINQKVTITSEPLLLDKEYQFKLENFKEDPISKSRLNLLPFYFSTVYIYPFIRLIMHMAREKNMQLKDLMTISRANTFIQYFSWFISSFFIITLMNGMSILILKAALCENGSVLNCSSFSALFLLFTIWTVVGLCTCFLVYNLIDNQVLAPLALAFFSVASFIIFRYLEPSSLPLKVLFYLTFQLGFLSGLKQVLHYEDMDSTGLQWIHYGMIQPTHFGFISIIMILGGVVCLLICVFIELCCPGRYGISKIHKRIKSVQSSQQNSPAVVQTNMLQKVQSRNASLKNFSMNMYDDQITVLLGLSGSGKSAVINLISGSSLPDSGWTKVDNIDVVKNTTGARKSLGVSPQHDALFGSLTAKQHMLFFSSLRNFNSEEDRKITHRYLKALELWRVRDVKARNLSEVDKRKLSVACSFCGNPSIVLLDEPSEMLPPCDRRLLWDLLQSEKRCRTVILTTYQIEEADILGDRVGILCDGELLFNGTSTFLKNTYGSGYQLIFIEGETCQEPQITALVLKYVPETRALSNKPLEICYNIPQKFCSAIIPLLSELETSFKYDLNMGCIGIGTTPYIEKFVNASSSNKNCKSNCNYVCNLPTQDEYLLRGTRLCLNQWNAMSLKKIYHIWHKKLLFFPLFFLLVLFFAGLHNFFFPWSIPLSYWEHTSRNFVAQDALNLNLNMYDDNCKVALVRDVNDESPLITFLKSTIEKDTKCSVEEISKNQLQTNQQNLNEKYVFALRIKNCEFQIYYSRKWLHSEAVAAAIMGNLAKIGYLDLFCSGDVNGKNVEMSSEVVNFIHHPYMSIQYSENSTVLEIECFESGYLYLKLLSISILSGFFAAYIIRERRIGYKLLQQVEGINMATFWLSHLLWDWLWLSLLSLTLLIIMTILLGKRFDDETVGYVTTLLVFNLALLPFLYVSMNFFKRTIVAWLFPVGLLLILAIPFEFAFPDVPFAFLYLLPTYSAIAALHSVCIHASSIKVCHGKRFIYRGCEIHPHWSCIRAALPYILMLFATSIFYFSIVLLYDRGISFRRRSRESGGQGSCNARYMTKNELRNHTLILENVDSNSTKTQIKDLSFVVKPMDVLGLVGERSGKTRINEAIISKIFLSNGRIYVKGIDVHSKKKNKYKAYKYIGYCPQTDSFETNYTGRENIKIFSLIRGIKPSKVKEVTEELAENLNFGEHLDKSSKRYTLSDKRKLSTAIAVIGTPSLILLDEPTSGVEIAHRSDVLDVLKSVNECGSSILLSSNNIEDFQSLCTQLALIKRGKITAIGPIDSFKSHSVRGLMLFLRIKSYLSQSRLDWSQNNENLYVQNITAFLVQFFENVYLIEKNQNDVLYYIGNNNIGLTQAFETIEKNRHRLYISDFYLTQENMELAFIAPNFRIIK